MPCFSWLKEEDRPMVEEPSRELKRWKKFPKKKAFKLQIFWGPFMEKSVTRKIINSLNRWIKDTWLQCLKNSQKKSHFEIIDIDNYWKKYARLARPKWDFFALFSNSVPSCINRILQSLPWYGRRSKLRRAKAKVRWVQRPKRQGHKLEAKASRVWTKLSGPQSYIRWRRFFHWKCKSIFQDIFFCEFPL